MHYVLLCKDEATKTNTSHNLRLVLSSLFQEFKDVFLDELPPGLPPLQAIEHRIDLIPGAPLPNKAPYHINPEETKQIQWQVQQRPCARKFDPLCHPGNPCSQERWYISHVFRLSSYQCYHG